ncbi:MAG: hypothetical protein A2W33_08845 [Chloroflexi bacterium RBG_16_52_11]|nr:MAG: hypothetical protein A2W33_08845 [Chloroflexi bacterium RBG_16_52_11]
MQIISNEKLIHRNRNIARYSSILGLAILVGGMIISFSRPELIIFSFAALILGFLISQVGIYFTNRWGREPRPDQLLNQALKGLDSKYRIYHFMSPASHLLVGPAGIWILLPRHQKGVITYERGRWRQKGGGFLQVYLRLFAQEGLGRPDFDISNEMQSLQKFFEKNMPAEDIPPIQAALIFTTDKAILQFNDTEEPPIPTLYINKLKELIRKNAKSKPIAVEKIQTIVQLLPEGEGKQPAEDE